METIAQTFNHNESPRVSNPSDQFITEDKIGIEIEIENAEPITIPGWKVKPDGSLRNRGLEYVFNGPIGGSGANRRLKALQKLLEPQKSTIQCSPRCSLHIHLDVRDLTFNQLHNLIILYAIVEPYLFELCGKGRDENIYCVALYKAQDQIDYILDLMSEWPNTYNSSDLIKYSAINLQSIRTFGSIEFRGHEGTIDVDRIKLWINHLLCLKQKIKNNQFDIRKLYNHAVTYGPFELLRSLFKEYFQYDKAISSEHKMKQGLQSAEQLLFHQIAIKAEMDIRNNPNLKPNGEI